MSIKIVPLMFYPGEHSGAHEKDGVLTVLVDAEAAVDAALEKVHYTVRDETLSDYGYIADNSEELKEALDQVKDSELEIEKLERQVDELEDEGETKDKEIRTLEDRVEELEDIISDLKAELAEKDKEISQLESYTDVR